MTYQYPHEFLLYPKLHPPESWKGYRKQFFKDGFMDIWLGKPNYRTLITSKKLRKAYHLGYRTGQYIQDMQKADPCTK